MPGIAVPGVLLFMQQFPIQRKEVFVRRTFRIALEFGNEAEYLQAKELALLLERNLPPQYTPYIQKSECRNFHRLDQAEISRRYSWYKNTPRKISLIVPLIKLPMKTSHVMGSLFNQNRLNQKKPCLFK